MNNDYKDETVRFPKRRKSKDNPYTLGYCDSQNSYTVSFQDTMGATREIVINQAIYGAMNQFELDDLSELNHYDRNIEHSELTEMTLYNRAALPPKPLEEIAERNLLNEVLWKAITALPMVQRRRLILYYFEGFTYEQIAQIEGCSTRAIKYSVDSAKRNIKKFFEKI